MNPALRGSNKAAEYILKEAEQAAAQTGKSVYIQTPRMEFFQCPDFQQKKAELVICQPYKKAYPVRAYLNGACTLEEGITAPFLFVGKGDDISLSKAKGAVVLVCDPIREDMINKIKAAGALGFVTICGTPLDQGEDRIPTQYRRKAGDLPGASVPLPGCSGNRGETGIPVLPEHSAERDFPQFRQCGSTHSGN